MKKIVCITFKIICIVELVLASASVFFFVEGTKVSSKVQVLDKRVPSLLPATLIWIIVIWCPFVCC